MKDLHEIAGLVRAGKDEEGEQQWIGTDREWMEYERLTDDQDETIENEVNEELLNNSKL